METFRTSYRRDFGWPWPLPVTLSAWPPPERTFQRPRECPPAEAADCPCPEHDWDADRGGLLAGYMCLAGKEARLLQRSQAVRAEIQRCLNRTRDAEVARRTKYPRLAGGEDWLSIYASDYTQKDAVPKLGFVDVLTELVSTGVPRPPLGDSLFAPYRDPTSFRRSPFTVPVYDPSRPVVEPEHKDIWAQWRDDFPADSEYTTSYSQTAYNTTRRCQPFKYPLHPQTPVNVIIDP